MAECHMYVNYYSSSVDKLFLRKLMMLYLRFT